LHGARRCREAVVNRLTPHTRVRWFRREVERGRDLRAAEAEEAEREQLLAERAERQKHRDLIADKKLQEVCERHPPPIACPPCRVAALSRAPALAVA
jgi:hypothetical protein